jgi:hypothetical protein
MKGRGRSVPSTSSRLVLFDTALICARILLCRHFEVPAPSIRILQQMSQHSAVLKAWKGVVTDALADHRFFQASPSAEPSWRPLVHALTLADRERMPELVGTAGCFRFIFRSFVS